MGLTERLIYELYCDIQPCTSVVSGPTREIVLNTAFQNGGWTLITRQVGHGKTEVVNQCDKHGAAA